MYDFEKQFMKQIALSLIFIFALSFIGFSQDLDDVFDDGGQSTFKNSLSLSMTSFIEGTPTLIYERFMGRRSGLIISAGLPLYEGYPMNIYISPDFKEYYQRNGNLNKGFLLGVQYRLYAYEHDGFYTGYEFVYCKRHSPDNLVKDSRFLFTYLIGFKWVIKNSFCITMSTGLGFLFYNKDDNLTYNNVETLGFNIPARISLTYQF